MLKTEVSRIPMRLACLGIGPFRREIAFAIWAILWCTSIAFSQQRPTEPLGDDSHEIKSELVQSADAPALSADRIIALLRQQPDLLISVKNIAAPLTAGDPSTITDDAVYDRIRQDASVRARIAQELSNRGYDVSDGSGSQDGAGKSQSRGAVKPSLPKGSVVPPEDGEQDRNEPQVERRPNPYLSIPSLNDLYSQVPVSQAQLKRFGIDTFHFGTGNANDLPMDLPVGPDYVLGPGDVLVVNMWGTQSQRLNRTIDRQGQIAVPEAGTVTLAGLTIARAQDTVQKALSSQFQNMHVELSLGRVRTVRVYVVGDVQRPGAYDVSSLSTPLNALYAAGGPTSRGSLRLLLHKRGEQLVKQVDLYDFLLHGVRSDVERLLPGDTLLVPPVGPQVSVSGMVRRPAIYELKGSESLKDILDVSGGVMVSAALGQINVERIDAHQRRTMLNVQLPENGTQVETASKLARFQLQDGDHVRVAPILPYNEKVVYLDGHVFRPGRFAFREGMTVTDLVHSYQDVMPEPANHAEIIRLQAPDFRPATLEFGLSEVLSGDDPILLQPFDVVRIFSRYEIDPPKVSIEGEVLRPGTYPLAQGMTVSGLVKMAGGFRRSAYRETADLTSYVVQNGSKISAKVTNIDLANAMEGDRKADAVLKPGDVLGIRQLSGWSDIGAAIKISGEVVYPGTYGIATGERLSAVLKRAGGLRPGSYPEGAVLERVQVREMGEKTRLEMIRRLETTNANVAGGMNTGQEQLALLQAMQAQQKQALDALRSKPASGRLVVRISSDISKWENTPSDIELRAGDVLSIPKRPSFVVVNGQVYNPSALTYVPGKTAGWYLRQAGGPTQGANKKGIFVLRANGSVVGVGNGLFSGGALSVQLRPGDAVIVPEKIVGSSMFWRNMMTAAQVLSSISTTAALAAAGM